ncbi:MAG: hypothetical protein ACI9FJ_000746 [Alteromonadaceae bacterium]|jgi:hypothetical protein
MFGFSAYQITGSLNTLMMLVSLFGLFTQLTFIWRRKEDPAIEHATDLLSINQFFASFLAYCSFFIHGYSIQPFNHFIVWPRLIAALMVTYILLEIYRDRHNRRSLSIFSICLSALVIGIIGLLFNQKINGLDQQMTALMIVGVTVFLAQGYTHQIRVIIKHGHTGAVALKMNLFIGLKDISTIAFALTMEFKNSWPLMLLATVSLFTKVVIVYLFRWVKVSETAKLRALANN